MPHLDISSSPFQLFLRSLLKEGAPSPPRFVEKAIFSLFFLPGLLPPAGPFSPLSYFTSDPALVEHDLTRYFLVRFPRHSIFCLLRFRLVRDHVFPVPLRSVQWTLSASKDPSTPPTFIAFPLTLRENRRHPRDSTLFLELTSSFSLSLFPPFSQFFFNPHFLLAIIFFSFLPCSDPFSSYLLAEPPRTPITCFGIVRN